MKIAFLSRYQNAAERGAEVFVSELVSRLSSKYQVDIFSGAGSDSITKVINGKYDLVIPINGRFQSLKVSLGRLFGRYKILISGHSGIGRDDIWNIVVARPDVFVALTEYMARWAKIWAFGVKVIKIPNGIDISRFNPNGERMKIDLPKPIILSVGALVWYKYHDKAIEAVSKLEEGSLLIVGSGDLEQKLQQLGQMKLGNRFKIMKLPYIDMPKLYRSTDLFTLPSWNREAFGIVYLEALASGLAVVAPDDLVRREIIGNAGVLTNVDNLDEYSKALEKALQLKWKDIPRKQAEKFSWDIIAKEYERVFLELFNKT